MDRPLVRWRAELPALKTEREGKEAASLAAAGFWVRGAQAMRSSTRSLLDLQ